MVCPKPLLRFSRARSSATSKPISIFAAAVRRSLLILIGLTGRADPTAYLRKLINGRRPRTHRA